MHLDYLVTPSLITLGGALLAWVSMRRILSMQHKSLLRWRRITASAILVVITVFATAVAATSGLNTIMLHHSHATMPGRTYSVDGHTMRLYCVGSGSPTLVLDAGLGSDGLIWGGVQPVLAKTTRVCSYDRAGLGWSDTLPPPRDADHVAHELHRLLETATIAGPIVLMGHSIAGIYIRAYASLYPENLAGLIFLDSSTPMQQRNPAFRIRETNVRMAWTQLLLARAGYSMGLPRLVGACSFSSPGFEPQAARLEGEAHCHQQVSASAAELAGIESSGEETVDTGPYGAMPVLVLSRDNSRAATDSRMADVETVWNQMQEDLKKLSTRSRRIIARGSGHFIQLNRSALIEKEVPLFIERIRGTVPQPQDYGSTTIE